MTETIATGNVYVDQVTLLPASLLLQPESHSSGWAEFKNVRSTMEQEAPQGWTFFFMAGEIQATVFGFDREKSLRTALNRLIANVKTQKCNSIEITQVTGSSFLKLPYVTVSAHPRHLQKGSTFLGQC